MAFLKKRYNKKIIKTEYYYEIWDYELPIVFSNKENTVEIESVDETKIKEKRKNFDELDSDELDYRLKRMREKRRLAKWKLSRLIDANFNSKTSFLTLTTKENITNRDEFNNMFKLFINSFNYTVFHTKKRELKYVAVLEKQKRGAWHAHLLMFGVPYVEHSELLRLWKHGAVRINKLNDLDSSSNAGRYISKYFTKGMDQNLLESFGKKSYLASRNLKKIDETKFFSKEELEFDDSVILYEAEYTSKIFRSEIGRAHV